jgi:hypothetical protein
MSSPRLPPAGIWQAGGHLSEEALAALADEQDILPADAISHADVCEHCARRLGEAALLSIVVGDRLAGARVTAPVHAVEKAQAPLPIWALLFGLGFVGAGAVPFLMGIGAWLPREVLVLQRSVPVFAHGLVALFAGLGGAGAGPRVLVSMGSLAILMMSAFAVSRLTPREEVAQ